MSIIAYLLLEIGILTAKYEADQRPNSISIWRYNQSYLNNLIDK
jgi:hypothetical protein